MITVAVISLTTVTLVALLHCFPRVIPLTLTMRVGHKK
jgi:hypothetical protein